MMLRIVIFLFSFILVIPTAFAAVTYDGLRESDEKSIEVVFPDINTKPTPALFDKIVRWLMEKNLYSRVSVISKDRHNFVIKAKILRRLNEVKFVGLSSLDELDALNIIGFRQGTRIDQNRILESIQKLRELYGRSGFFNPVIRASVQESDKGEVTVTYDIQENSPCLIDGLKFNTQNTELKKKIDRLAKDYLSSRFSEKSVADLELEVNAYLQEERYLNARLVQKEASYNPDKTKATLVYDITDPHRFFVTLEGNERLSRGDILRAVDFENFDRTSLNPASEIADRVRKNYLSKGYAQIKVRFQTNEITKDFMKEIVLNIKEGPRVKISKIEVVGRLSRPADYYSEFIENNSTEAIDDGYYVKEDLEVGYQNLLTELNNQGLLRARIQSARAEFSNKGEEVKMVILLEEGPLTKVKSIHFEGAQSFPETELIQQLGLQPNSPLRLKILEKGIESINNLYTSNGYIEMKILNQKDDVVRYLDKGGQASIHLRIKEGPKVFVREIIVEGNVFTKSYVVEREIDIEPGELLTPEKLNEGRRRLDKLNLFSSISVRTLEANSNISHRTLIVTVGEKKPGTFKMGAGITNKRRLTGRGFSGISYDNLWGTARRVSLRGSAEMNLIYTNYLEYDVNASYLEPFLFDSKYRGRVNIGRSERVDDYDEPNKTSKIRATNRFALLTERDITSRMRFVWNAWTLESVDIFKDPKPNPAVDPFERTKEQVATIGPLLDIDFRDNPFLPTKGFFARVEADYSSPAFASSEGIHFVRTQLTFSYYFRLWKKWIWANSIKGGYGKHLDRPNGIPEEYAFFLGGYSSIRGFSGVDGDRTPNPSDLRGGQTYPVNKSDELIVEKETHFYLLKSEVRFPIWGILGGVLFYDAGEVLLQGVKFSNSFKHSLGIGFRLNTPVGPISLDYGKKLVHRKDESEDHIHLSIGTF